MNFFYMSYVVTVVMGWFLATILFLGAAVVVKTVRERMFEAVAFGYYIVSDVMFAGYGLLIVCGVSSFMASVFYLVYALYVATW